MRIEKLCNRDVVTIRRDDSIVEAAKRMRERHVGDVVVVDGTPEVPVGIVTDRDLVVGVLARDTNHLSTLAIGDILTTEVVTTRAEIDHEDVLRSMQHNGIRRMPVVDARGALVGIVSLDDLLDHLAYELAGATSLMSRQAQRERDTRRV